MGRMSLSLVRAYSLRPTASQKCHKSVPNDQWRLSQVFIQATLVRYCLDFNPRPREREAGS